MKQPHNNTYLSLKLLQDKNMIVGLRKHFKLNIYEVKIWLAILSRGIASAGELTEISGVPRSRCYDVLETLEKKGFIIMKIGKPIKYLAVSPDTILERVKKNVKEENEALAIQIQSIEETEEFRELELISRSGLSPIDISSISKSIVGRSNINRQMKDMISGASLDANIVLAPSNMERSIKILKRVAPVISKKDIKVKIYCPYSDNSLKFKNIKFIEHNSASSFVTVDGKEMLFIVSNEDVVPDYEVAIWIKSPFFVNAVNTLFGQSIVPLN